MLVRFHTPSRRAIVVLPLFLDNSSILYTQHVTGTPRILSPGVTCDSNTINYNAPQDFTELLVKKIISLFSVNLNRLYIEGI